MAEIDTICNVAPRGDLYQRVVRKAARDEGCDFFLSHANFAHAGQVLSPADNTGVPKHSSSCTRSAARAQYEIAELKSCDEALNVTARLLEARKNREAARPQRGLAGIRALPRRSCAVRVDWQQTCLVQREFATDSRREGRDFGVEVLAQKLSDAPAVSFARIRARLREAPIHLRGSCTKERDLF